MAIALSEKKIPFEVFITPEGLHGMGLAQGYAASKWTELCVDWLRKTFDI
jgi:hypothetical protein